MRHPTADQLVQRQLEAGTTSIWPITDPLAIERKMGVPSREEVGRLLPYIALSDSYARSGRRIRSQVLFRGMTLERVEAILRLTSSSVTKHTAGEEIYNQYARAPKLINRAESDGHEEPLVTCILEGTLLVSSRSEPKAEIPYYASLLTEGSILFEIDFLTKGLSQPSQDGLASVHVASDRALLLHFRMPELRDLSYVQTQIAMNIGASLAKKLRKHHRIHNELAHLHRGPHPVIATLLRLAANYHTGRNPDQVARIGMGLHYDWPHIISLAGRYSRTGGENLYKQLSDQHKISPSKAGDLRSDHWIDLRHVVPKRVRDQLDMAMPMVAIGAVGPHTTKCQVDRYLDLWLRAATTSMLPLGHWPQAILGVETESLLGSSCLADGW